MKVTEFEQYRAERIEIPLNVVVLARNQKVMDQFSKALSKVSGLHFQIERYSGLRPLSEELQGSLPDIVILEIEGGKEETINDIMVFLEANSSQTEVFVTLPDADLQIVKELVRTGISDVLLQPIREQDLHTALISAKARKDRTPSRNRERHGKVTSLMSVRGNAGGTFLAVNMAYQLATELKQRTILVDMDIQFGTIAHELDMVTDRHVLEALTSPERIDKVFLDALISRHPSGLDVLASPADMSRCDHLKARAVERLIDALTDIYDQVIINLPVYVNDALEEVFRQSDHLFVVSQDTLAMIRNLQMVMEQLQSRGISPEKQAVLLYQADRSVKDVRYKDLQKIVGQVPIHSLGNDYKLAVREENEGKAASEFAPGSGLIKEIAKIVKSLVPADALKVKKRTGLLGRFF